MIFFQRRNLRDPRRSGPNGPRGKLKWYLPLIVEISCTHREEGIILQELLPLIADGATCITDSVSLVREKESLDILLRHLYLTRP